MIVLRDQTFTEEVVLDSPAMIYGCRFLAGARLVGEGSRIESCVFEGHVTIDGVEWSDWVKANCLRFP